MINHPNPIVKLKTYKRINYDNICASSFVCQHTHWSTKWIKYQNLSYTDIYKWINFVVENRSSVCKYSFLLPFECFRSKSFWQTIEQSHQNFALYTKLSSCRVNKWIMVSEREQVFKNVYCTVYRKYIEILSDKMFNIMFYHSLCCDPNEWLIGSIISINNIRSPRKKTW